MARKYDSIDRLNTVPASAKYGPWARFVCNFSRPSGIARSRWHGWLKGRSRPASTEIENVAALLRVSEAAVILFSDHDTTAETGQQLRDLYHRQKLDQINATKRSAYVWKKADKPWVIAGYRTRDAWAVDHPEKYAEYRRALWVNDYHRGKVFGRPIRGSWKPPGWYEIMAAFGYACAYCGISRAELRRGRKDLTCDHIIALSKGGDNATDNLAPACKPCNTSKWNRDLLVWAAKKGRAVHPLAREKYRKLTNVDDMGRPGRAAGEGYPTDFPLAEDRRGPDGAGPGSMEDVA